MILLTIFFFFFFLYLILSFFFFFFFNDTATTEIYTLSLHDALPISIAERIRALGHFAPGSYADFGKLTSLADVPHDPPKALEMVRILVAGHEAVARTARSLFPQADKASDEPTADLLTQRLTVHEQTAWMLRALLED